MAMVTAHEELSENLSRFIPIRELDKQALQTAKNIFEDYKKRGVIISGRFEDSKWTLTNETQNVGLTLLTFEGGINKEAMSWIGCTYHEYIACVKAYILFNLGSVGLSTLQEWAKLFNKLAIATSVETMNMTDSGANIISLLELIPGGNEQRDAVIEELEEKVEQHIRRRKNRKQRQLADFKSYLRFNEALNNFWQRADKEQKLFYFPLYFWWNLTAILPLRPMEFLITPRDCLRVCNGEQILTVRRTKLKGGKERISYRVADDYELREYSISECLADEIRLYIEATEKMQPTTLNTLLRQEPHLSYLVYNRKVHPQNHYYTYGNFNLCRKYFYDEVINQLEEDIAEIRPGDTRHLAMTNLILSGGSPVICRELAGHANIDVSSHYYANISNLVECATLERYRKTKGGEATLSGDFKYPVIPRKNTRTVDGGRCTSLSFYNGSIEDCLKVMSRDGHIGDCRYCSHYLPDNPGVMVDFYDAEKSKLQVDADSQYLIQMIEFVRKGLGHTDDIASALLRLQHSGDHYGKCLWEQHLLKGKI